MTMPYCYFDFGNSLIILIECYRLLSILNHGHCYFDFGNSVIVLIECCCLLSILNHGRLVYFHCLNSRDRLMKFSCGSFVGSSYHCKAYGRQEIERSRHGIFERGTSKFLNCRFPIFFFFPSFLIRLTFTNCHYHNDNSTFCCRLAFLQATLSRKIKQRVQGEYPLLFVVMVAMISATLGYLLHS